MPPRPGRLLLAGASGVAVVEMDPDFLPFGCTALRVELVEGAREVVAADMSDDGTASELAVVTGDGSVHLWAP